MKDDIKLPPLPEPFTYVFPNVERNQLFHTKHMQDYAREAIKADRQQRGEPVAVIRFERNKPGNENEMPKVISCNRLPDGDYQVFLAPQPTEPVKVPQHLIERLQKHCEDKNNSAFARSTMREAMQYLIAEPVVADAPAQEPSDDDSLTIAYMSGYHDGKRSTTPEGWRMVPMEPTREMLDAYVAQDGRFHSAREDWATMLKAAPKFGEDT